MSLYTDTDEFKRKEEEALDEAVDELVRQLSYMFGSVGVQGLKRHDLESFRNVLGVLGWKLSSNVEGFYVRESSKVSQENSLNVLKAVLAGTAAATRDLTGEEPAPWVKDFVLDGNAIEQEGNSVYIRDIEDRAAAVQRIEESLP